jgi:hypothetical protein
LAGRLRALKHRALSRYQGAWVKVSHIGELRQKQDGQETEVSCLEMRPVFPNLKM